MGPNCTQAEGFILGVGSMMFTIAGPVIVYELAASKMGAANSLYNYIAFSICAIFRVTSAHLWAAIRSKVG